MSLADRLAAARDARGVDELPSDDVREPGEGLPEVDHTVPEPASPVDSAVAAADAARGGKRRADVPPALGPTSGGAPAGHGSQPPRQVAAPEPAVRRGFVSTTQSDRIEELKSAIHVQLLQ